MTALLWILLWCALALVVALAWGALATFQNDKDLD